jgi:hypothetical protein
VTTLKSHLLRVSSLLAIFLAATAARAQAPFDPADLPARTIFYVVWRGAPAPAARQANSLYALWDDPGFMPVRDAFAAEFLKDSNDSSKPHVAMDTKSQFLPSPSASQQTPAPKTKLTRQDLDNFVSLLDNGFVLGYVGEPEGRSRAAAAAAKPAHNWNGIFIVYNRTGKEAVIEKIILQMQTHQPKDPPQITPLIINGVPAIEIKQKDSVTYAAQTGKYAVLSGEKLVLEGMLKRLLNPGSVAAEKTLASNEAFREARASIAPNGILDFFVRVPDLSELPAAPESPAAGPATFRPQALMQALRLDAIHSFTGTIVLDGPRTRFQGALLGDASRGTLFDIWAAGPISPAMVGFAPAETISFNQTRIDPQAVLALARRVAVSFMPPGQTSMIDMVESGFAAQMGMPLSEAVDLFTGEFSSFQLSPDLDTARQLFVIGIRKKPETLKLLRTVLNERITSERSENGVTFLKISLSNQQGAVGIAQWNFYHVAVTNDLIVGAASQDTLRSALAQSSSTGASGLAASAKFQAFRTHLPPQPNGIAFEDFERVNWQAAKEHWLAPARKTTSAPKRSAGSAATKDPAAAPPAWLVDWNPSVLSRHLHTAASASWKDAKGVHFGGWLD